MSGSPCLRMCKTITMKNISTILKALFVRILLLGHNVLAVWRVTIMRGDERYWFLTIPDILLIGETIYCIVWNGGIDNKWFCPCFLFYLLTTLPAIWLLELDLIYNYLASSEHGYRRPASGNYTPPPHADLIDTQQEQGFDVSSDPWIVIIEESLVYLLVLGRWLLPRGEVSRAALSELLITYLGMASDIMELFALFDEDKVRRSSNVSYAVLTIWSLSFIQFVPVLVNNQSYRSNLSPPINWIKTNCGEFFVEIVVTCLTVCLQDVPFLILRLYIMTHLKLVTYSIVFFVIKNIVVILLLAYKLLILCLQLPGCYEEHFTLTKVVHVDLDKPVHFSQLFFTEEINQNGFSKNTINNINNSDPYNIHNKYLH